MITYTFNELMESTQNQVIKTAEKIRRKECFEMGIGFSQDDFKFYLRTRVYNKFFSIDENYNILISEKYCRQANDKMTVFQ